MKHEAQLLSIHIKTLCVVVGTIQYGLLPFFWIPLFVRVFSLFFLEDASSPTRLSYLSYVLCVGFYAEFESGDAANV